MLGLVQYPSSPFNTIRDRYNNSHFTGEELEANMTHGL